MLFRIGTFGILLVGNLVDSRFNESEASARMDADSVSLHSDVACPHGNYTTAIVAIKHDLVTFCVAFGVDQIGHLQVPSLAAPREDRDDDIY